MAELDPNKLTWAALLGGWVDFARTAVGLPDDARGRAWRAAAPEIIGLQAVAMALGETDRLSNDERALGIDRSRILIDRHADRLHQLFRGEPLHPMLDELIRDARASVERAERRHAMRDPL